ncbi:MAG TPA: OsmC family protein [Phenylobacterium sp.]|uniref:OsmC family protein n=1 Tax=Phenylobacterium sp. TaxID=1871053 RepID=UPI002B49E087|nr:OsmC family protein [Phenylobacterium sp.]HKR86900.1 OsmC family protein [Phenylobacterium sp.]
MARYRANVDWALEPGEDFAKGRYGRGHTVGFEPGPRVRGTASAQVVGAKWAEEGAVDPEQMLVAAISACHMLSFLHVARLAGFVVTRYRDEAEGLMEQNAEGRIAVTRVALRPQIAWDSAPPETAELDHLHHQAHEACFIANSVKTEVVVESRPAPP